MCIRPDSPLAPLTAVPVDDLLAQPVIAMRSGYVMHRYVHRLPHGRSPSLLQRRRAESVARAAQDLHEVFVRRAREWGGTPT